MKTIFEKYSTRPLGPTTDKKAFAEDAAANCFKKVKAKFVNDTTLKVGSLAYIVIGETCIIVKLLTDPVKSKRIKARLRYHYQLRTKCEAINESFFIQYKS